MGEVILSHCIPSHPPKRENDLIEKLQERLRTIEDKWGPSISELEDLIEEMDDPSLVFFSVPDKKIS